MYKQTNADLEDIAKKLEDPCGIIVGTFNVLGSMHLNAIDAYDLVKVVSSPAKYRAKYVKNIREE